MSIWLWVSYRNMSLFQIFPFVSGSMIYFLYFNAIYNEIYALTLVCIIYLHSIILDQRKYDQRNLQVQSPFQTTPLTSAALLAIFIFIRPKSLSTLITINSVTHWLILWRLDWYVSGWWGRLLNVLDILTWTMLVNLQWWLKFAWNF